MPSTVKRQSAAVMFTDIAGYTSIMASDEEKALSLLQDKRKILKPLIKQHDGIYVKGTGDGTLSYFDSAYKASKCAKLFQESIYDKKNMNVRVGIHVGDIVLDDGDVYGDGVNVASRLESMSPVGGICVSNTVYDELRNKKEFDGVELGLQSLKGVGRLIEIFGLKGEKLIEPNPKEYVQNKVTVHSDDEVPSIAIIPFRNKGKEEDAFYAYGICADLISDCSSAGLIRVESLDNIEKVENHNRLNAQDLASKLFVRYIATGTLWKLEDVFQLSIELYDTKEKKLVWTDRWEEKWDNLPVIKENLSDGFLQSLSTNPKVVKKSEIINTKAYEIYLEGKYRFQKTENLDDKKTAQELLQKAIELDNNLIDAKLWLAWSHVNTIDFDKAMEIFISSAKQADNMDKKAALGESLHGMGGIYFRRGEFQNALKYLNRSYNIHKSIDNKDGLTDALITLSLVYSITGNLDKALEYNMEHLNISNQIKNERQASFSIHIKSHIFWRQGDLEKALEVGKLSLELVEKYGWKWEIIYPLNTQGLYNLHKGDYNTAIEYLEQSLSIQKEIGNKEIRFYTIKYLYLAYKKIGKKYDESEIINLIKETVYMDWEDNYCLYQLFEEVSYLEIAYKQIQETVANLEPDVAAKFLSYPIPSAIVEEWEKVK
jgi:class 3 adenylate cyclase/TolB-like protein